jgi:hypothetical protein
MSDKGAFTIGYTTAPSEWSNFPFASSSVSADYPGDPSDPITFRARADAYNTIFNVLFAADDWLVLPEQLRTDTIDQLKQQPIFRMWAESPLLLPTFLPAPYDVPPRLCPSGSGTSSACPNGDGLYCGENGVSGDPNTLYLCIGGMLSPAQICTTTCQRFPAGQNDSCATDSAGADTTPPTTVVAQLPLANSRGWNKTDVTINFHSTDNQPSGTGVRGVTLSGAQTVNLFLAGSAGVRGIQVTLSGAQTVNLFLAGSDGAVTIGAEGTTEVTYFAIDNAGNAESAKSLTVKIDKTPPLITGMPSADCTLWPPDHKVVDVATVSASDALSGMASFDVTATSNEPTGKHGPDIVITGAGLQPRDVQLRAERLGSGSGRVYPINATATDVAENTATAISSCTVPHDQGQEGRSNQP